MKTNSPHFQERQQTLSRVNIHEQKKRKKKLLCKPEDFFCVRVQMNPAQRKKGRRVKGRKEGKTIESYY